MSKNMNPNNVNDMKLLKFFLAAIAGFGLVKMFGFLTEDELDEEMGNDIYDEEDHPLFV
ncbi:hypothetical protein [Flavobacterium akiainvivens]|uniref:hypothetical protein n=1 Tax=Flavobacterium akiainvivens TaxID=1202724 RepID=UPI0008DFF4A4|nr:hypothetical protein [Flavobacterium akiainvivens]SFQ53784.1 hypothetical protein SAMN05444144_10766 [Flavobacterium akiainvivens]